MPFLFERVLIELFLNIGAFQELNGRKMMTSPKVVKLSKKKHKLNVGPADTGHARQKWGESMRPPSPSMHRPFKKNSYKKKL